MNTPSWDKIKSFLGRFVLGSTKYIFGVGVGFKTQKFLKNTQTWVKLFSPRILVFRTQNRVKTSIHFSVPTVFIHTTVKISIIFTILIKKLSIHSFKMKSKKSLWKVQCFKWYDYSLIAMYNIWVMTHVYNMFNIMLINELSTKCLSVISF